jgi:hypothetical protein
MSRDSNGTMTSPISAFIADALIKAADFNTLIADIVTELTNSIDKGGRTTPTANLPMGGFKHTGAAAASETGQYMEHDQVNAALALKTNAANPTFSDSVILPKTSGKGIKVDEAAPTFPWVDLPGELTIRGTGPTIPTYGVFRGGKCSAYSFAVNDEIDFTFHVQHDHVPGSDLYIHYHWLHNGTAISGNIVASFSVTYAKGHNQAAFGAEKTLTSTYATVDIGTTPRWQHRIEEVKLATPGGSPTLLDTNQIEMDGIIQVNLTITTIPTITGGTPNEPFILAVDLHYQSTGVGTKQKSPPFWT